VKEGVGKYTWPSGAVYRGDWSGGCMQGHGTLQGPEGSTYTGAHGGRNQQRVASGRML